MDTALRNLNLLVTNPDLLTMDGWFLHLSDKYMAVCTPKNLLEPQSIQKDSSSIRGLTGSTSKTDMLDGLPQEGVFPAKSCDGGATSYFNVITDRRAITAAMFLDRPIHMASRLLQGNLDEVVDFCNDIVDNFNQRTSFEMCCIGGEASEEVFWENEPYISEYCLNDAINDVAEEWFGGLFRSKWKRAYSAALVERIREHRKTLGVQGGNPGWSSELLHNQVMTAQDNILLLVSDPLTDHLIEKAFKDLPDELNYPRQVQWIWPMEGYLMNQGLRIPGSPSKAAKFLNRMAFTFNNLKEKSITWLMDRHTLVWEEGFGISGNDIIHPRNRAFDVTGKETFGEDWPDISGL